jgi:hypothetical protein
VDSDADGYRHANADVHACPADAHIHLYADEHVDAVANVNVDSGSADVHGY